MLCTLHALVRVIVAAAVAAAAEIAELYVLGEGGKGEGRDKKNPMTFAGSWGCRVRLNYRVCRLFV